MEGFPSSMLVFGPDLPLRLRKKVYGIIVNEMGEKQYGGKWFPTAEGDVRADSQTFGAYSPDILEKEVRLRRGGSEVFCPHSADISQAVVGSVRVT